MLAKESKINLQLIKKIIREKKSKLPYHKFEDCKKVKFESEKKKQIISKYTIAQSIGGEL